ncbi:radial spoke protein [Plasmopara halstedii]|uniref:Radial spoke head protein 9 homolog n=1 Tax=Plasmopara halstedii TaxID=4781 RepID=A0A0P1ATL0_PLAHL|nr:radial spoke protein [Plasmopara halstedii]CEG44837.1 radial spoke protein [Plasmopara halstedii]|eukprot:XP_024581206.1 radial spoke protein [Plasmopara halstedii]
MELEQLDVVSRCIGQTLTPQERSILEIGMLKRNATEIFQSIRFWGRISGEAQDYLISVAVMPGKSYLTKKFYFCTNSSPELQQFPHLNKNKSTKASMLTSRLKGDPTLLLDDDEDVRDEEEGETPFCELDRLAYIVNEIDHATSIVPLGAYIVSPMRQVIANPSFHGLTWDQSLYLHNFFHFRYPDLPERAQIIEDTEGLVRARDFLDPLFQDLDGAWTLCKDNTGVYMTLLNYVYPGSFTFHRPLTTHYGSVYFGDGRKNLDIAFML